MSTPQANEQTVIRSWYIVDAADAVLGRLSTKVATTLRGKHKPTFTPHVDTGDFVVVINAEKIKVSANKENDKLYFKHTQFPGGIKAASVAEVRTKHPERLIEGAVKGMLPKGILGRKLFKKLKVYAGESHPHQAQNPQVLSL